MSKIPVFEYFPNTSDIEVTLPDGTKKNIEINAGWAFGKGFHPTTNLCLKKLESIYSSRKLDGGTYEKVLDVGCGTGILSICSAYLGASNVTGLDIDNIIVNEARANVSGNGLDSAVKIVLGSIEDIDGVFDLVTANVLIGSMLPMSAELAKRVSPGGLLLLSGIKDEESDTVLERFSCHGLKLKEKDKDRGWVALLFQA